MSIFVLCHKILLSCAIRADLIAVHFGADCHRAVCIEVILLAVDLFPAASEHFPGAFIQPVPLLVVGEPALDRLSVLIVVSFAAVILYPAVSGLWVDNDLHKPVQDSSSLHTGGVAFRVKLVV